MKNVLFQILRILKKIAYYVLEYGYVFFCWTLKVLKIQYQRVRRWVARRGLKKSYTALGNEIYSLYKQDQTDDLLEIPSAEQRLRKTERAEERVFDAEDNMEDIRNAFKEKKESASGKYRALRASLDVIVPEQAER